MGQPFDIQLSMNSDGNVCVSWKMAEYFSEELDSESYLIYGKLDSLGDMSALASEGKVIQGKYQEELPNLVKVDIKDLQAEELYVYQVGNEVIGYSPIYSFLGPIKNEEHYPSFAVLGETTQSIQAQSVLSQLIGRSLIERLDGLFIFGKTNSDPLFNTIRSNIPVMIIPSEATDPYFSVKYSYTYVILINTSILVNKQIEWLKKELTEAQDHYWIIVFGHASLSFIDKHFNFTEILMEHHVDMYISYGEFYSSTSIKYPLSFHAHTHFQDTSELHIIQQGPSWVDKNHVFSYQKLNIDPTNTNLTSNNSIFATKNAGYGILNPKYATLVWQEFKSDTHRTINQVTQYRIDLSTRKVDEIKNFKIIFVITFLIFVSAFIQVFVQKELDKRRLNSHKPLENGILEF